MAAGLDFWGDACVCWAAAKSPVASKAISRVADFAKV